ncbi:hypothetical protein [Streptomyces sioyaensis]|uniref:hypothetical protein n=1 Tax=Streptomyces sioyaensis TaxID=67364 RepID=UPI0036E280F2
MTDENIAGEESGAVTVEAPPAGVDERFIEELVSRAQVDGLQLTGEGGLLQQPLRQLLEQPALAGQMTDHLGYDKHNPAGENGGNSRIGKRSKTTVSTITGAVMEGMSDRAEPAPGPRLPGRVHRLHQREDRGSVDDLVMRTAERGVPTVRDHASRALVMCSWSCCPTCPRC